MIMTCTVATTGGACILYAMGAALGGLRRRQLGAFAAVWCAWEVGQVQPGAIPPIATPQHNLPGTYRGLPRISVHQAQRERRRMHGAGSAVRQARTGAVPPRRLRSPHRGPETPGNTTTYCRRPVELPWSHGDPRRHPTRLRPIYGLPKTTSL